MLSYVHHFGRCLVIVLALALAWIAACVDVALAGEANLKQPQLVIEDNDFRGPAGSDIQSVLPLLANPNVDILGFTVVTGDDWEHAEAAALLRFLEIAKRTDVPVFDGAVYPLINSVAKWRLREQQYGRIAWKGAWGGLGSMERVSSTEPPIAAMPQGAPTITTRAEPAAAFLIRAVHAHPHEVTIIEAGPMTNLALAIRLDPIFAANAKQLVFMGALLDANMAGSVGDSAWSEDFNIEFDPEAAHIALTAPWPHVIAVGNVSGTVMWTHSIVQRIAVARTAVGRFLQTYYQPLPMWDEVATAVAVDPTLVTKSIDVYMDVDLSDGVGYGHVHLWSAANVPAHLGIRKVTYLQALNQQRFTDEIVRAGQSLR